MTILGQTIREQRKQLGLTLDQLAHAAGCSKAYLSTIENNHTPNPPRTPILQALEQALNIAPGQLTRIAGWQRTPNEVKAEVAALTAQSRKLAALLRAVSPNNLGTKDLDTLYNSGQLQQALQQSDDNLQNIPQLLVQVPLINHVAAGYPSEFTDLDFPARVADEYIAVPGIADPDAFAARVVGQSMTPDYNEGDIIVFSPAHPPADGQDCFVRLLPDHHTTFKRVFYLGESQIKLQPLNPTFPPTTIERQHIAGIYPAVFRLQRL